MGSVRWKRAFRRVARWRRARPAPARSTPTGLLGLVLTVVVGTAATCGNGPVAPAADCPDGATGDAVLFIGNSLTIMNDLPGMVAGLSIAAGDEAPLRTSAVVAPGVSLEDHWKGGDARDAIGCRGWSVVVLQQGPSSLMENREHLIHWTGVYTDSIRAAGAEPALYMVWPSLQRSFAFDAVSDSYRLAAESVDGMLMPAGEAWRAAWRRDEDLALYGPDDFHPSVAGTYAVAVVMYARLSGRSPVGLPREFDLPGGGSVSVPEADAAVIQEAAAEAIEMFGR